MSSHGGARKGAGRKATRAPTTRVVTLLDAAERTQLERLMRERGQSACEVLRAGIAALLRIRA